MENRERNSDVSAALILHGVAALIVAKEGLDPLQEGIWS